jgi:hypothetical protein
MMHLQPLLTTLGARFFFRFPLVVVASSGRTKVRRMVRTTKHHR